MTLAISAAVKVFPLNSITAGVRTSWKLERNGSMEMRSVKILQKMVLIIDFNRVGNIDTLRQLFEMVRKILLGRYGAADFRLEEGEFRLNLAQGLNSGTFKRIIEWRTKTGTLRRGIPRRL